MKYFIALVHKDQDSAFGISFPDLPSVFSAADEEDDLTANAIEALRLWAEDETLPTPSSFEEISSGQMFASNWLQVLSDARSVHRRYDAHRSRQCNLR